MARIMETVLYYNPGKPETMKHVTLMKSVLVRMGVRIRNISGEQVMEKVGYLAGLPGFESTPAEAPLPEIPEQVMVLKNFSGRRIDELLMGLRKAGVPKIELKAVLTENNSQWTFYQLYEELKAEHKAMTEGNGAAADRKEDAGSAAAGQKEDADSVAASRRADG